METPNIRVIARKRIPDSRKMAREEPFLFNANCSQAEKINQIVKIGMVANLSNADIDHRLTRKKKNKSKVINRTIKAAQPA